MGILDKLIGGSIAEPVEAVGNVLDKLFTSDGERLDKAAVMERLRQQPAMAQVEINKLEAQHRSIFVAGWRPFIGWVCGIGLANAFLVTPLLDAFLPEYSFELPTDVMAELVIALLGLGALRTFEKVTGKAK